MWLTVSGVFGASFSADAMDELIRWRRITVETAVANETTQPKRSLQKLGHTDGAPIDGLIRFDST
jgi:hypothetical protein